MCADISNIPTNAQDLVYVGGGFAAIATLDGLLQKTMKTPSKSPVR